MWKSSPSLLSESHQTDDFPIFDVHSLAVSLHCLLQERGKKTSRKAADAGQEGSGWENGSRCQGFAAREAFLKPLGEHSQSSPGLHVEIVFLFQASHCTMPGTRCSLCKLAAQSGEK